MEDSNHASSDNEEEIASSSKVPWKENKEEENSDEDEKEPEELAAIKEELSHMPFDELQKLRERLGSKLYNKALHGKEKKTGKGKKIFKRENKNRPMEMSSKKPVGRFRETVSVKKKLHRDPRFDDLSGEYSETIFQKTYSFLDDVKSREKNKLMKQLKKEKDYDRKQQLHYLINRMNQQEQNAKQKKSQKQFEKEIRKKEHEEIKQGKKPFYLRKSEQKQLQLAEKFKELKKSGNLEKYLSKKRKKNASKDRKKLPARS